jgi:sarcosine oxidase delta subunit
MCEELWRFVGVDVDEFRRHGIEPCVWLEGLESLRDLRRPYWFGLAKSDLAVRRHGRGVELALNTTNSVDAVFFPALLGTVKAPSLIIEWGRKRPTMRYVSKSINLIYYIALGVDEWPWPIELNAEELERILNGFSDEELAMFVAGIIDGDGTVQYIYNKNNKSGYVYVEIAVCKACPKKFILDVLRDTIAERFGIVESIRSHKAENVLMFSGEDAVRLLRRVTRYMHHPIRRLRAELILALYDGRISPEEFERLYEPTKYKRGKPDIKRNHALEALTQAAPQTHTHGEKNNY